MGAHDNDWIVMQQTRPVATAAPTAMTTVAGKSLVNEYGNSVSSPASFAFQTPVSADNRGETIYTITSDAVTYGGSTHQHTIRVSDRTCGPMECEVAITGTGAATLSWLVNGRESGDSGTGACYQPGEYYFENFGEVTEAFHNPTRDGQTALPWTPAGQPSFPYTAYPERDTRTHSGRPVYFRVWDRGFETCVNPMDFMSIAEQQGSYTSTTSHGDTSSRSALWYEHRLYQRVRFDWGADTDALRATTHRGDYWTYAPTPWTSADQVLGRFVACYTRAGYWNEAKVYDLTDIGSPITLTGVTQTLGVSNFRTWTISRKYIIDVDNVTNTVNSLITRSPVASRYIGVILRNTTTGVCHGVAVKVGDPPPANGDMLQDTLGEPDFVALTSFWDGAHATGAIKEAYAMPLNAAESKGSVRPAGWIGSYEYRCVGTQAAVLQAFSDLYTRGHLDTGPEVKVPTEVRAGTIWPNDRITLRQLRERVMTRWERQRM